MKNALRAVCVTSLPLVLLAGCAAKGEFPSLAPRPIELGTVSAPAAAQPLTASDPARVARFDAAVSKAESGTAAFAAALAKARRAVSASDGKRGSERWIAGQMAVSQLERTTAPAQSAMAELDQEKRQMVLAPRSLDEDALNRAVARVENINANQQAQVRALLNALNPR